LPRLWVGQKEIIVRHLVGEVCVEASHLIKSPRW
jgi:hypothetical protein